MKKTTITLAALGLVLCLALAGCSSNTQQKVESDVKDIISSVEDDLSSAASKAGEDFSKVESKIEDELSTAGSEVRDALSGAESTLKDDLSAVESKAGDALSKLEDELKHEYSQIVDILKGDASDARVALSVVHGRIQAQAEALLEHLEIAGEAAVAELRDATDPTVLQYEINIKAKEAVADLEALKTKLAEMKDDIAAQVTALKDEGISKAKIFVHILDEAGEKIHSEVFE